MQLGYKISSEEHSPHDLIRYGRMAEDAGFSWAGVSDHFHPWVDQQGESPFVWSLLGGLSQATEKILVGTWVTCPTVRIHPAIIAQAAATAGSLFPGRFFLGVGSGEYLNEHILADRWPEAPIRLEMLEEAVEVIRKLWEGGMQSHHGKHYTVENARIYTLPDPLPPIYVAASGPKAAQTAGRIGDGFIGVAPKKDLIEKFDSEAGAARPKLAEITVCWAADQAEAKCTALKWWPNALTEGGLSSELALPSYFEAATKGATDDQIAEKIPCGPDPEKHLKAIREYADAGYDYIGLHQVGPDQEGFFNFVEREIMPALDLKSAAEAPKPVATG